MVSDPIRTRLLELAEARGVSLTKLSQMLGKNPSYLQQFIRKGSPRKLEEQDRGMLARFFAVDESELGRLSAGTAAIVDRLPRSEWVEVPRLPVGASAGPGAQPGGEQAFDTIRFSSRWLRTLGLQPAHLSTITVTGDSMEPTLRHGDEILVDCVRRLKYDGVHVVRAGDSLLVKRIDMSQPQIVVLVSDNPAYPPARYPASEVEVIGRVVWKGGAV